MIELKKHVIICVDDDPVSLLISKSVVESLGYTAIGTTSPLDLEKILHVNAPKTVLILCDFKMPEISGVDLRKQILNTFPDIPFAIVSGEVTKEMALEALQLQIIGFLDKPLTKEKMKAVALSIENRIQGIAAERELIVGFVNEANDLLEEIELLIINLGSSSDLRGSINRIYALAHTIKGMSSFFLPNTLNKFSHEFESFMDKVRSGKVPVGDSSTKIMLKAFDIIKNLMAQLRNGTNLIHPLQFVVRT